MVTRYCFALGISLFAMSTGNPQRDADLAKADEAVQAAIPAAVADPDRPLFHFHAPAQWMNDPNGPILYKGWYHLFYQHNPYGSEWGNMHWGHARSKDLVHWEGLPIALGPSLQEGEKHVFSGSVFPAADGKPVALYTSIGDGREPEQWIATPEKGDLIRWRKDPAKITQAVHDGKPLAEWRDPFLFTDFGLPFMVTGGGRNGRGVVAIYKSTGADLKRWVYLGDMFTHPDADARNVECPNLFQLDGKWVLLVSVHGRVEAFVGELRNTSFVVEHRTVLGEGSYASQIVQGLDERVVEFAWVPTQGHRAWNGYLTLPSEMHVAKDGTLLRTPIKELSKLRGAAIRVGDLSVDGETTLTTVPNDGVEIQATLDIERAKRGGLRIGSTEISYDPATRQITVGGHSVILDASRVAKGLKLQIFRDRVALDVYAADGAATFVVNSDHAESLPLRFFSEGGSARVHGIVAYEISNK